jgi:hypothetical protein
MSIYGTYKVKKLQVEDKCMTLAEINELPDTPMGMAMKGMAEEAVRMAMYLGEGVAKMGMCVPEEQRAMAIEAGMPLDENGCLFEQEAPLVEENGAYFIDAGDEKMPLEFDAEGYLVWDGGMYYGKI